MPPPEGEIKLGDDKRYDAAEFIKAQQDMKVTPHVAQNKSNRASAAPYEIPATKGFGISMQNASSMRRALVAPSSSVRSARLWFMTQESRSCFHDDHGANNLVHMHTLGPVRPEMASDQVNMGPKLDDRASQLAPSKTVPSRQQRSSGWRAFPQPVKNS